MNFILGIIIGAVLMAFYLSDCRYIKHQCNWHKDKIACFILKEGF